ncbi:hypothetical protein EN850_02920 [Mesorhizobium sp. M8A.F.Ca.ET.207.01.1.1]|uniref:hypothetical protein n=1 Tax=Mesorhizobium sp. M8A.F.Ca.ET.207.01.1.1 TaxID=2563968 RepID=UPI00109C8BA6|nr:hypothetical protein [Mesorhizobium sp. M8A.F.Ca.ET.207.01.1.1]TGQ83711.1 hypothetical protein EN850_02920 [Mesorhizobium sp. M8A.F.Ca.ET.207.01.1.1]
MAVCPERPKSVQRTEAGTTAVIIRMLAVAAMVAISTPSLAQQRLECTLFGEDYPVDRYPDGQHKTWWIDGDRLNQGAKGSVRMTVPGLAFKKILKRDADMIVAEWGHEISKGASYRFVVDLRSGETKETTFADHQIIENVGICKLEGEV